MSTYKRAQFVQRLRRELAVEIGPREATAVEVMRAVSRVSRRTGVSVRAVSVVAAREYEAYR